MDQILEILSPLINVFYFAMDAFVAFVSQYYYIAEATCIVKTPAVVSRQPHYPLLAVKAIITPN